MNADELRSPRDRSGADQLLAHRDVKRVNTAIERREAEGPMGTRRRLLATAVRLSRGMAAGVHRTADECIEGLGVEIPVELYVFASASFNAMCVKPEEGRLFLMFSSSLLEAFEGAEFRFVMGHELGHYLYDHHAVPVGYLLGRRGTDPRLALQLSTWSRYAEISADRAGAYCARDLHGVARALFKLSSGLRGGELVRFELDAFMRQVDDMQAADAAPGQGAPSADWFMTHPFSPLRARALALFDRSALMRDGGDSRAVLEDGVQLLMTLMEPDYLEGRTPADEAMRRALFAGALVIAGIDGEVSAAEVAVFERYFGDGSFSASLDRPALATALDERLARVVGLCGPGRCTQLLRDLVQVALADGVLSAVERREIDRIGAALSLPANAIEALLSPPQPLD